MKGTLQTVLPTETIASTRSFTSTLYNPQNIIRACWQVCHYWFVSYTIKLPTPFLRLHVSFTQTFPHLYLMVYSQFMKVWKYTPSIFFFRLIWHFIYKKLSSPHNKPQKNFLLLSNILLTSSTPSTRHTSLHFKCSVVLTQQQQPSPRRPCLLSWLV